VFLDLMAAFAKAEFFRTQEAQKRAGPQAQVYQGPAISAQHLREVREARPAEHIDPGKVAGNVYSNSQIGMTYQFPAGWSVEPQGAVEPAVEHYREKVFQPWFDYWLRGQGELKLAEATVFETGANQWKEYEAWPPRSGVEPRRLYFREGRRLAFDGPGASGFDEYLSDPANPVPYRPRPVLRMDTAGHTFASMDMEEYYEYPDSCEVPLEQVPEYVLNYWRDHGKL
jgi:hypothetical protein